MTNYHTTGTIEVTIDGKPFCGEIIDAVVDDLGLTGMPAAVRYVWPEEPAEVWVGNIEHLLYGIPLVLDKQGKPVVSN